MIWNHDISTAPRGKTVTSTRKVGNNTHEITDFVPDVIWLATKCGKVIRSYWIPENGKTPGRWSGPASREEPIAWQAYVVPAHPDTEIHESPSTNDKACSKAVPQDEPSPAGIGSELPAGREGRHEGEAASADLPANLIVHRHIFLDDAGSGQ